MVLYHTGNGNLVEIAIDSGNADKIRFVDSFNLDANNVQDAIVNLKTFLENKFQTSVDAVYFAIVARGVSPESRKLEDVVAAIGQIETDHYATYSIEGQRSADAIDLGRYHNYRYILTSAMSNTNTLEYILQARPGYEDYRQSYDLGETNEVRYILAGEIYASLANPIYDACVEKGFTPQSKDNADLVAAVESIQTNHYLPYDITGQRRAEAIDLGEHHSYRYIFTSEMTNTNTLEYVLQARPGYEDYRQSYDLGETNEVRYILAGNIYGSLANPIYDACVSKGSTPQSKDIADLVTAVENIETGTVHTGTFVADERNSQIDMGESHAYRYVDTTGVPNSNTTTKTFRWQDYIDTSKYDLGADNNVRYIDARTAINTYTETARQAGYSSGYTSGSASIADPVYDECIIKGSEPTGKTADELVAAIGAIPNYNSATKTFRWQDDLKTSRYDLGVNNNIRYVDARDAINTYCSVSEQTGKSSIADPVYDACVDRGFTPTDKTASSLVSTISIIQTPPSGVFQAPAERGIIDMGETSSYRYVSTSYVNNFNSQRLGLAPPSSYTDEIDLGADNKVRYVLTNLIHMAVARPVYDACEVKGSTPTGYTANELVTAIQNISTSTVHTGTYYASTSGVEDMGASHSYRYVDTTGVPNYNAATKKFRWQDYIDTDIYDLGVNNNVRYINAKEAINTYTETARQSGYNSGYSSGYSAGDTAGYNRGYSEGDTAGYNRGYSEGYDAGYAAGGGGGQVHTETYYPVGSKDAEYDMGQNHNYRYVRGNYLENYCEQHITLDTQVANYQYDLGPNHAYRFINAMDVYMKGYDDGRRS